MKNLPVPNSSKPNPKGLSDHQHLELDNNKSGIQTLLDTQRGYILGRFGNEFLRFNTDAHLITISPTGGGKGTGLIIPNLLDHSGSLVVVDIRGETVAKTATARRLQGHKVVVLDPFDITEKKWGHDSYNPFDRLIQNVNSRSFDDLVERLTDALMFDPSGRMSNEPIWDNATKELLSGLISLSVRYWEPYRQNLVEILDVLNYSPSEMERFTTEIQGIIDNDERGKKDRQLKSLLKILTESKTATKITDNALVQARTLLKWAGNGSFEGMIDDSTFSFSELQERKVTVYLVVPEEFVNNCAIWIRLMLESAVFSLQDVASTKGKSTSQLEQDERVLFLLDELPAFGQLDIISSGMATLRGRGVNLWLFIQNLAQLEATYGKEKARVIIGNAAAIQVFGSNELEELEYFSRLIGEEFFDVQSVGITETVTEGTTITKGKSYTVNNSQSVSNTAGTSDTVTKATAITWNNSFSKGNSKSSSTSQNKSSGSGTSSGTSEGKNKGEGTTFERNLLWTTVVNNNENKGESEGKNKGKTSNEQEGSGTTNSKGETDTSSNSKGGSKTTSKAHTDNKSTTHSEQTGESFGTTESVAHSHSTAIGRSITVKQERMKIETVRSIREKISNRNQLLQIRGHHPFFAPRMSYFVRFTDADRYMFPDMAAMVELDIFDRILSRKGLDTLLEIDTTIFDAEGDFEKHKYSLSDVEAVTQTFGKEQVLEDYKVFITETLQPIYEVCQTVEERLFEQRQVMSEAAIAGLGYIGAFKSLGVEDFEDTDFEMIEQMRQVEQQGNEVVKFSSDILDKYLNLPITKFIPLGQNYIRGFQDLTFQEFSKDRTIGYESYMDWNRMSLYGKEEDFRKYQQEANRNKYPVSDRELKWLIDTYTPLMKNLVNVIQSEQERLISIYEAQEKTRIWIKENLQRVRLRLNDAVLEVTDKELLDKQNFFLKRHGME